MNLAVLDCCSGQHARLSNMHAACLHGHTDSV